jgi:hypothetical protein
MTCKFTTHWITDVSRFCGADLVYINFNWWNFYRSSWYLFYDMYTLTTYRMNDALLFWCADWVDKSTVIWNYDICLFLILLDSYSMTCTLWLHIGLTMSHWSVVQTELISNLKWWHLFLTLLYIYSMTCTLWLHFGLTMSHWSVVQTEWISNWKDDIYFSLYFIFILWHVYSDYILD